MAKAPKTATEAPAADVTDPTATEAAAAATIDDAAPPAPKVDPATLPAKIKMVQPHGFIDDEGRHCYWQQGQVVFEPADIALLHERKANFEAVEDAPAKQ